MVGAQGRGHPRRFALRALGKGPFTRGSNEGGLRNPPPAFYRAQLPRLLGPPLPRTFTDPLAVGFCVRWRFLSRAPQGRGQTLAFVRPGAGQGREPFLPLLPLRALPPTAPAGRGAPPPPFRSLLGVMGYRFCKR